MSNHLEEIQNSSDSESVSEESRISDDSGIEDWNDEMTIQTELEEEETIFHQLPSNDDVKSHSPKTLDVVDNKDIPLAEFIGPLLPTDANEICTERKDVLDDNGIPGVAGLYNLGNTCFMNASLQCLFATKPIHELLSQGNILQNGIDHTHEPSTIIMLIERFQELANKINKGNYSLLYPDQFHASVGRLMPIFGDYKQHDSQEFLSFFLNVIHDLLHSAFHLHTSTQNASLSSSSSSSSLQFSENKNRSPTMLSKDDFPDNITGELPKRLKMDDSLEQIQQEKQQQQQQQFFAMETESDAGVVCEDNMLKGEKAWRDYICNNRSIIADTMQGQFQSVITCEKCSYISTTHEPFMFLSLPIPHAMEKEIVVTWVPSAKGFHLPGMVTPKKYLVVVNKNGSISDVKKVLFAMLKKEDHSINTNDIVLAEVHQSSSVKVLDDRSLLSYLSKTKTIYAIEVLYTSQPFCDGSDDANDNTALAHTSINNIDTQTDEKPCVQTTSEGVDDKPIDNSLDSNKTNVESVETKMETTDDNVDTWHSCSICLEEVFDDNLKVHSICGGMLCEGCMKSMLDYSQNQESFACPTCQRYISGDDYKPMVVNTSQSNGGETKKKLRSLLVPIMFRHDSTDTTSSKKFELFGHPVISSLLSETKEEKITEILQHVLLPLDNTMALNYDVLLTDGTGLSCGRCEMLSPCTGCRVTDLETIQLKPGCCITLHFHGDNLKTITQALSVFHVDNSVSFQRNTNTVLLSECFHHFADIEVLSEDNPWYCPQCKTNQTAIKNMSVTRWPDVLIIHLKRFYYEGSQGCKITCPVSYPLKDLNVESITSADYLNETKTTYDLYSVICHTGTLFGGHYTAFSKPVKVDQWYFFNDESFKEMCPSEEDQEESYVLFYHKTTPLS